MCAFFVHSEVLKHMIFARVSFRNFLIFKSDDAKIQMKGGDGENNRKGKKLKNSSGSATVCEEHVSAKISVVAFITGNFRNQLDVGKISEVIGEFYNYSS